MSHCHQADYSSELHTASWLFAQYVNEHSNTLEIRLYPSSVLGQEREVYEGMQIGGGANCAVSGTAILSNFNKKIGVLDLPFLWRDYEHAHRVLDGEVGRVIADELKDQGFHVLAWMDSWGYRNVVTSKREVTKPEQLAGLKIRTIETPIYIAAVNAMGANATPMAFGEIYTSLQTGVLDGFEHSAAIMYANRYYEVSKYIALTRHLFGPVALIYSQSDWEMLFEDERTVINEAAVFARDIERALAPVKEKESLRLLQEEGMVVHEIDTTAFREKAVAIQDKLAAERGAEELLSMIRDMG